MFFYPSMFMSYIQTQNTRIAYETLLTLQLLERTTKHNSLRVETKVMQDCQSSAVGGG